VRGIRLTLRNATGATLDLTLPPGMAPFQGQPGWTMKIFKLRRFTWVGVPHLMPFGIRQVRIDDRSRLVPGQVRFAIKGKGAGYAAFAQDFPLSFTIGLEGVTSPDGNCGQVTFAGLPAIPGCAVLNGGGNLRSK